MTGPVDEPQGDRRSPEELPPLSDLPELSYSVGLLHRVQAGDTQALNELFERYRPRLQRIISIRMGAQLGAQLEAEDLMQEVYIVAMQRIHELEPRSQGSILSWLAKIAENKIKSKLSYHYAQKRTPQRIVSLPAEDDRPQEHLNLPADELSPSQRAVRNEFRDLVDAHVEDLKPTDYRDVILQRDYYAEDWENVRVHMKRDTVEAAKELYRRAHRRLLERLRPHLDDGSGPNSKV